MKLGFVGSGEITSAIVTGLSSAGARLDSIRVSPRNLAVATNLANRFPGVAIASSNQDVLDSSEVVVIAVRPPVARSLLSELRFRPDHRIISLVSALSLRRLSELVAPATRVTRAVPLPSTARRIGPTAIYPRDPVADQLFASIGGVFPVETEDEFDAMCAATATVASFYAFIDEIAAWLSRNGVSEGNARDYVGRMFWGLISATVDAPERSFQSLANDHATAGDTNEQFLKYLLKHNFLDNVSQGLDSVMQRIRAASRISGPEDMSDGEEERSS